MSQRNHALCITWPQPPLQCPGVTTHCASRDHSLRYNVLGWVVVSLNWTVQVRNNVYYYSITTHYTSRDQSLQSLSTLSFCSLECLMKLPLIHFSWNSFVSRMLAVCMQNVLYSAPKARSVSTKSAPYSTDSTLLYCNGVNVRQPPFPRVLDKWLNKTLWSVIQERLIDV